MRAPTTPKHTATLLVLDALRQLFRNAPPPSAHAVPKGARFYVVGDVHGRLDLFEALIDAIETDDRSSGPANTTIVLLGDLVDRGPDSAGVITRAIRWHRERSVVLLAGNHEEMFLDSFEDTGVLRHFLRHGGRQTILSYGIPRQDYDGASLEELQVMMRTAVPAEHIAFLAEAKDYLEAGDYLFVHAGIVPDVALEEQARHHLRWIRDPFLDHAAPHSHMVIHGHTITDGVEMRSNRIGIDTGAYRSGKLTALVLERTGRRVIQTAESSDGIVIESKDKVE
ncbi:metallophosphoesterase family protein [Tsuneonella sp. HG249]